MEVKILGRVLGTASGWDGDLGENVWFYDFKPNEGIDLPAGDLLFDETNGMIGLTTDEGEISNGQDICKFLAPLPRSEK